MAHPVEGKTKSTASNTGDVSRMDYILRLTPHFILVLLPNVGDPTMFKDILLEFVS